MFMSRTFSLTGLETSSMDQKRTGDHRPSLKRSSDSDHLLDLKRASGLETFDQESASRICTEGQIADSYRYHHPC